MGVELHSRGFLNNMEILMTSNYSAYNQRNCVATLALASKDVLYMILTKICNSNLGY